MTTEPIFRIENAENDTAEMWVGFRAEEFAGKSSAWISVSQIGDFASSLAKYPLDTSSLPVLAGGFWDPTGSKIVQEHIHVSARPKGRLGTVSFLVRLAVPRGEASEPGIKYSASLDITSDYEQLSAICRELDILANGGKREATFVFERRD